MNKVKELNLQLEDLENRYKRALADYQNLEKRVRDEKQEWIVMSNKNLILRLLPILDTLILANRHVKNEGLSVSIKQFFDILKNDGVEKIETLGKKFDPSLMECVEIKEGNEGEILEEIRPGYTMGGKVVRAALVNVGGK